MSNQVGGDGGDGGNATGNSPPRRDGGKSPLYKGTRRHHHQADRKRKRVDPRATWSFVIPADAEVAAVEAAEQAEARQPDCMSSVVVPYGARGDASAGEPRQAR